MTEQERFRYRLSFHKTEAMRFTGHLDLYRALERTIRRAGLPLAYRGGFSPHPRLQLAAALPLGFTSRAEVADLWLEQSLDTSDVLDRLQAAAPPGVRFTEVRTAAADEPALQEQVIGASFSASLSEPPPADLAERVGSLLSSASVIRQRRGKSYDLRPLIDTLEAVGPGALVMRLSAREGATGRPDEVLEALGLDPLSAEIERTSLTFAEVTAT
ncbi:MAG: TIGR03936 family radical SAM-associated protein [Chloroflexi bacterium]|nr:TIGR03936 family radical SAM-associated protein [Chloroflexota bacterium]